MTTENKIDVVAHLIREIRLCTSGTCVTGEGGEHHDAQSAEYYRVELNGGFWPILLKK